MMPRSLGSGSKSATRLPGVFTPLVLLVLVLASCSSPSGGTAPAPSPSSSGLTGFGAAGPDNTCMTIREKLAPALAADPSVPPILQIRGTLLDDPTGKNLQCTVIFQNSGSDVINFGVFALLGDRSQVCQDYSPSVSNVEKSLLDTVAARAGNVGSCNGVGYLSSAQTLVAESSNWLAFWRVGASSQSYDSLSLNGRQRLLEWLAATNFSGSVG